MSNRLPSNPFWAQVFARIVPFTFLLILFGCGGASSGVKSISPVAPPPPPTPGVESTYNFGMQCGSGDTQDCEGPGGSVQWPTTQAQPGCLRLHDTGTFWSAVNPANGTYSWSTLDNWLDTIAQQDQSNPRCVIETFTSVPCWAAPSGQCGVLPVYPNGTNAPPADLTPSGSPSFNAFVQAFVTHCSAAGACVANLIKYYDMWNEWDLSVHWTGSMSQVYQMVSPAVAIIKQNVNNSYILMPSTTPDSDTGLGYQTDFQNWLNYENSNGKISDWINWHSYMTASSTTTNSPENEWSMYNANFVNIQQSTTGWEDVPWVNSETNFNGSPPPGLNYTCPSAQFSAADCTGQIVRWQILHDSNGAASLDWYKWNETIGSNSQYETAYYWMMKYLVGGKFTSAASYTAGNGASTWTAPFSESGGTSALWVWTPNEAGTTYTVPAGYVDYRDLQGGTTNVTAGSTITIGVQPFMLEQ